MDVTAAVRLSGVGLGCQCHEGYIASFPLGLEEFTTWGFRIPGCMPEAQEAWARQAW